MLGCIAFIVVLLIAVAASWAFTCAIIDLICLCFGLIFSLPIATGIWLILCLLSCFLGPRSNNNSKK